MNYCRQIGLTLLFLVPLAAQAGDASKGKEKSVACQSCHGMDGNSPAPQFPNIAGQHEDYLLHSLRQYKSGERKNAIMAGMVAALSDDDLQDLAAYYALQRGLRDTPSK